MRALHTVAMTRRALFSALLCLVCAVLAIALSQAAWREEALPRQTVGVRLDVNTAGAQELALLPGMGPVLAKSIEADRQARGRFETVVDLQRVKGIGPRKWAQMKPWLEVNECPNLSPK